MNRKGSLFAYFFRSENRADVCPYHGRGFTLVELLVVIAIISVLAGFLLPVLSKVRRNAHIIVCKNNLRELYLAIAVYAEQVNKSRLPLFSDAPSGVTGVLKKGYNSFEHGNGQILDVLYRPEVSGKRKPTAGYITDWRLFWCPLYPRAHKIPGYGGNYLELYGQEWGSLKQATYIGYTCFMKVHPPSNFTSPSRVDANGKQVLRLKFTSDSRSWLMTDRLYWGWWGTDTTSTHSDLSDPYYAWEVLYVGGAVRTHRWRTGAPNIVAGHQNTDSDFVNY